MNPLTVNVQSCIAACWQCRDECQSTLFNHCLQMGGTHVSAGHVKLMTDCIQICQTSADFMTRGSELHKVTCAACAEVCEACAQSCDAIGGVEMTKCADICRHCAEICRSMSSDLMPV